MEYDIIIAGVTRYFEPHCTQWLYAIRPPIIVSLLRVNAFEVHHVGILLISTEEKFWRAWSLISLINIDIPAILFHYFIIISNVPAQQFVYGA